METDEEETERLLAEQQRRADREAELAEQGFSADEVAEHERRAEKARYLEAKLAERADSEAGR